MLVTTLAVVLCCLLRLSSALSWPRQYSKVSKVAVPTTKGSNDVDADSLPSAELTALFQHRDMLPEVARRSDCFRQAAASVRVRCSELDMDEEERVGAAIAMTLCELRTAKHLSPPLECTNARTLDQGNCVEALSRSAQFWSSYSGYLRDVPQLCFSFRRWHDIDTARDVYRNITHEKIAFLRFLLKREQDNEQLALSLKSYMTDMNEITGHLHIVSDTFESIAQNIATQLAKDRETALADVQRLILDSRTQTDNIVDLATANMNTVLTGVSARHANLLQDAVAVFSRSLTTEIEGCLSAAGHQLQTQSDLLTEVSGRWHALGQGFSDMNLVVAGLKDASSDAIKALETSTERGLELSELQSEATRSAAHLVDTLTRLTVDTQDEFKKINLTITELQDGLAPQTNWLKNNLIWLVEFAMRVEPNSLKHLDHALVFRVFSFLCSAWIYLFHSIASSAMSCIFVLYSCRRYFWTPPSSEPPTVIIQPEKGSHPLPIASSVIPASRFRPRRSRISRIPDHLCNHWN